MSVVIALDDTIRSNHLRSIYNERYAFIRKYNNREVRIDDISLGVDHEDISEAKWWDYGIDEVDSTHDSVCIVIHACVNTITITSGAASAVFIIKHNPITAWERLIALCSDDMSNISDRFCEDIMQDNKDLLYECSLLSTNKDYIKDSFIMDNRRVRIIYNYVYHDVHNPYYTNISLMQTNVNILTSTEQTYTLPSYIKERTKRLLVYESALAEWYDRRISLVVICYQFIKKFIGHDCDNIDAAFYCFYYFMVRMNYWYADWSISKNEKDDVYTIHVGNDDKKQLTLKGSKTYKKSFRNALEASSISS